MPLSTPDHDIKYDLSHLGMHIAIIVSWMQEVMHLGHQQSGIFLIATRCVNHYFNLFYLNCQI